MLKALLNIDEKLDVEFGEETDIMTWGGDFHLLLSDKYHSEIEAWLASSPSIYRIINRNYKYNKHISQISLEEYYVDNCKTLEDFLTHARLPLRVTNLTYYMNNLILQERDMQELLKILPQVTNAAKITLMFKLSHEMLFITELKKKFGWTIIQKSTDITLEFNRV